MLIEAAFLALFSGSHFFHCTLLKLLSQWDTFDILPKTQFLKKLWFPLIDSRPSPFHWALDVWWSNPNIFYVLMQNKQSQITHILPPYWFVEVVNQIKLPFLFLSFHLTYALSGSVLARTLNWNSLKHRASFVVRLFFFFQQGVCEKEQDFLSWAQVPPLLHCCLSGILCPGLLW